MKSNQKFDPELRTFALTLNFYSPKAYNYVREKFNKNLPHPDSIRKWYKTVNGEPGISQEALGCLRNMVESYKRQHKTLLCNLVMDEMSIRKHIEWTGQKFTGYVSTGVNLDTDQVPEAKEALVYMLVALNFHWKVTVAYYLIDGLTGEERASILNKLLSCIHETGLIVTSITFDGAPSNVAMTRHLGANLSSLESLDPTFRHPVDKDEDMFIFLDFVHMLKLIRNCLASQGCLEDGEGNLIEWKYFVKLVEIQENEGLQLATKLKKRHIQWFKEKMKVRIAAQTFSNSVADALMYLCEDAKIEYFQNVQATAKFCKIMNNVFDIFNTHSLYSSAPYQKPPHIENYAGIFSYLNMAKQYISTLKLNKKPVLNTPRKTGFLGILVDITSFQLLFRKYLLEKKLLDYIISYKLSQDHLEMYFCAVRSAGGFNNNPTARQFESIFKRLLIRNEIKASERGNAISIDSTSILYCSSITKTKTGTNLADSEEFEKTLGEINKMDFLTSSAWHLTSLTSDIVAYIAGFIIKGLKKCITCELCLSLLESDQPLSLLKIRKTYGK